jgi:23S rRNA (adenine2503-C2)-methyltransferase
MGFLLCNTNINPLSRKVTPFQKRNGQPAIDKRKAETDISPASAGRNQEAMGADQIPGGGMLKLLKTRKFANGEVHALELPGGFKIETTDTFLPEYTRYAINGSNALRETGLGNRSERWMIGVSVMSGCLVRCRFCATGNMPKWRNLTADEIFEQVKFVGDRNPIRPYSCKEFKINYTRMGDPFLNQIAVQEAIQRISYIHPETHHYVSTIGIKDADYSWIKDNITLQISLHAMSDERRDWLIPYKNKATIAELGKIRTQSNLKTTLNLTLVEDSDFDIDVLKEYFDPEYFFIKLSPINKNAVSDANGLSDGVITTTNLI